MICRAKGSPRKGWSPVWASSASLAAPHYLICGERGSGKPILPRFCFFLQLVAAYRGYPEPPAVCFRICPECRACAVDFRTPVPGKSLCSGISEPAPDPLSGLSSFFVITHRLDEPGQSLQGSVRRSPSLRRISATDISVFEYPVNPDEAWDRITLRTVLMGPSQRGKQPQPKAGAAHPVCAEVCVPDSCPCASPTQVSVEEYQAQTEFCV